jgi:hypothetical protein
MTQRCFFFLSVSDEPVLPKKMKILRFEQLKAPFIRSKQTFPFVLRQKYSIPKFHQAQESYIRHIYRLVCRVEF